jgi:pyruvate dehydrogenase E1 component
MSEKLLVPDIGDFEEVEVIEVLAKEGDQLNINDPVITIESDKSSVEIPSTINGKVEKVEVKLEIKSRKEI